MGLSASQARLLSITRRLNNNELESEIIAMQKMHLSDRNTQACNNYINALDATKFEYISYNDTAIQESVSLTFNAINQYSSLKNQYALFNNENQIYVSATDAANFEKSTDLHDFLDCYGLFDQGKAEYDAEYAAYRDKLNAYNDELNDFNSAYSTYMSEFSAYSTALEDYNARLAEYNEKVRQYEQDYADYLAALNAPDLYASFSGVVGTSDSPTAYCYREALGGDSGCYLHLLNHLLDFDGSNYGGTYYTTTDQEVKTSGGFGGMGTAATLAEVSDGMNEKDSDGNYVRLCDGDDDLNTEGLQNIIQAARDAGREPTELELLMSDYKSDGSLKSLKEKAIDMYYIIQKGLVTDQATMYNMLVNFTDGDMQKLTLDPPEEPEPIEPFDGEMPTFDLVAPQEPVEPQYTLKIYDKALAQWYTNLFYIMDGQSVSDEIGTSYDENANFDYFTVDNAVKTCKNSSNYIVMDNQSAGDSSWLKFALENGLVHLQLAGLKTEINGTRMTWEGIELSSTSDMVEVEDSTKIAKAEAEYKSSLAQIEAEDKQFDVEMSKLDSEHSSFEKEIESIKTVMEKNVEKSFNAFS